MIAALFVERGGVYWDLPGVDAWDKERDARLYRGPHPVVAHPPCQLWGNFAALNYKRYGGSHNMPAWWLGSVSDENRFVSAVCAVRKFGGVLEHPAGTHAFPIFEIPTPRGIGWQRTLRSDEYVCEVWQSAYGCPARKRTWLFYVGGTPPRDLDWSCPAGTHQIGVGFRANKKPRVRGHAASRTPIAFRDALINLARHSRGAGKEAA